MGTAIAAGDASRDSRWSTDDLRGGAMLATWMELLSQRITEMQVDNGGASDFSASWRRYGLGPIDLNFLKASPQRVLRTSAMVARTAVADYDLLYMRRGPGNIRHCGIETRVPEGSFILLDNEEPYELRFPQDSICLTTHIDDRWIRQWVPHPKALAARAIAGANGWGAPLVSMLETIADHGLEGAALPRPVIADQFGAMLALMAGAPDRQASLSQGDLLARLKRRLRERFDDPGLDPAAIARDMGISKRHLHSVFAQSSTTFGAVLMDIRLSRASEMLSDPRYRAYRIGDIAWACGFGDPSHFARRFRARYGRSPASSRVPDDGLTP